MEVEKWQNMSEKKLKKVGVRICGIFFVVVEVQRSCFVRLFTLNSTTGWKTFGSY